MRGGRGRRRLWRACEGLLAGKGFLRQAQDKIALASLVFGLRVPCKKGDRGDTVSPFIFGYQLAEIIVENGARAQR